jgi:CheY-like chemotaxis protein
MSLDFNDVGGPWRIALVDDDAAVLRALSRLLTMHGYAVTAFHSAKDLLASLGAYEPEMMLLDLRMPEVDGLTLQQALVERGVRIPTVFLSGHGDVPTARWIFSRSRATNRRCSRRSITPPISRGAIARATQRWSSCGGAFRR